MSGTVSTGGRTLRESPSARFAGGMVVGGRGPRDTPLELSRLSRLSRPSLILRPGVGGGKKIGCNTGGIRTSVVALLPAPAGRADCNQDCN
jgi:hypothetical protein